MFQVGRRGSCVKLAGACCLGAVLAAFLGSCATASGVQDLATEYYNLGQQFEAQKDQARASEFYSKSLNLNPDQRMSRYNLARLKLQKSEYAEAAELLAVLSIQDPDNQTVREMQAFIEAKQENYAKAWELYIDVQDKTQGRVSVLYNLGLLGLQLGREQEALQFMRVLVALRPDEAAYLRLAGLVAMHAGAREDGLAWLEAYRLLKQSDTEALVKLANELDGQGGHQEAIGFLAGASAADDKNGRIWLALARLQLTDDPDAAQQYLGRALDAGFKDAAVIKEFLSACPVPLRSRMHALAKEKLPDMDFGIGATAGGPAAVPGKSRNQALIPAL